MDRVGIVEEKRFVAQDFVDVVVKLENKDNYEFKAGQFAFLTFNICGKNETRAYSFACSPSLTKEKKILEFGIKKKENGLVSTYVVDELQIGEKIWISQPTGFMTVDNAKTQDYVFIAVGSGITPIKSIISYLSETKEYKNIVLIYGNKTSKDVAYHDFFMSLKNVIDNYEYYPVLSREKKEGYYYGHVQDVLFDEKNNLISNEKTYFLCGLPKMVFDVKDKLTKKGITHENILFEAY